MDSVEYFKRQTSLREPFETEYRLKFFKSRTYRIPKSHSTTKFIDELEYYINLQSFLVSPFDS